MAKKWIQKAIKKPGSLSKMLGVPEEKKIPVSVLNKIRSAETGDTITFRGKKIKVTTLLKRRAALAKTLKKM